MTPTNEFYTSISHHITEFEYFPPILREFTALNSWPAIMMQI